MEFVRIPEKSSAKHSTNVEKKHLVGRMVVWGCKTNLGVEIDFSFFWAYYPVAY